MVIVSLLSHVDFGSNDHQDDAPHFTLKLGEFVKTSPQVNEIEI